MKRTILLSAVSALLLGTAVIPAAASDCPGFVPPNNLNIPVGSAQARGIIEAQFNEVLDTVQRIYAPIVAARGAVLELRRLWTDGTVNASASQSGKRYIVNMYGGLARHETITMDGFALVVCHELGHHLGGAPMVSSWATLEGQADYYANNRCLKQVFADPASSYFTRIKGSDELAAAACEATYSSASDREICVRSAMAGKSVSYLFKILRNETVVPGFDTPDTKVVTTMMTAHPATQCRMDTYLQGSLCTRRFSDPLSYTDPLIGSCTRSAGFTTGFRPLCWYKPANNSELLPPGSRPAFGTPGDLPGPVFSTLQNGLAW